MSNESNSNGKAPGKPTGKKTRVKREARLTAAADVLQGLLQNSKSHLSDGFLRWRVEQEWREIVGEMISEQTAPCAFENGTLFIWVRHSVWMQQLYFFQESIKEKVNKHVGREWAKDVKLTLSRRALQTTPGNSED